MPKVVVLQLPDDMDLGEVLHTLRRVEALIDRDVQVYGAIEAQARNVLHIVTGSPDRQPGGPR